MERKIASFFSGGGGVRAESSSKDFQPTLTPRQRRCCWTVCNPEVAGCQPGWGVGVGGEHLAQKNQEENLWDSKFVPRKCLSARGISSWGGGGKEVFLFCRKHRGLSVGVVAVVVVYSATTHVATDCYKLLHNHMRAVRMPCSLLMLVLHPV